MAVLSYLDFFSTDVQVFISIQLSVFVEISYSLLLTVRLLGGA
jgi:hypothetical protein